MRLTAILWLVATLLLPSRALAASVPDAIALVAEYDPQLATTLASVPVVAGRCPGATWALACTDGVRIWYDPAAIAGHNPELTDRTALAAVLVKEGFHVQTRTLTSGPGNCVNVELAGGRALGDFWDWIWYGQPSNTAFNPVENVALAVSRDPLSYALEACRHQFGLRF